MDAKLGRPPSAPAPSPQAGLGAQVMGEPAVVEQPLTEGEREAL